MGHQIITNFCKQFLYNLNKPRINSV